MDKIRALKKQINALKELVKIEKDAKYLVQFSSKGKQHNENILADHIIQLLELRKLQDTSTDNNTLAEFKKNPSTFT